MTLTEFLLARIADDEARWLDLGEHDHNDYDPHPAPWPQLLAECEAKRRIVELHSPEEGQHPDFCGHDLRELPCPTLHILALPYADHPDWQRIERA